MSALSGRRLVVNTSSLAAASFWRIFVSFALQLLVARRLDAAALGTFALMFAWLQIAQITSEAGLPQWMAREGAANPGLRGSLLRHILSMQVAFALVVALLLTASAWLFPQIMPPLPIVAFSALSLPFYAVMSACLAFFESAESFERVLVVDAVTNALLLVSSTLLLLAGAGLWTLFLALVVCQVFSAILALPLVWRSRRSSSPSRNTGDAGTPSFSWRTTLRASSPFYSIALADVVQQRADLLILGAIAAPEVTGIYAAAASVLRVVVKLVQAFWRALFPTLGRLVGPGTTDSSDRQHISVTSLATGPAPSGQAVRSGVLENLFLLALRYVLIASVAIALVVTPLADSIAVVLFGSDFVSAGAILALLIWSAPLYAWELGAVTRLLAERKSRRALSITLLHLLLLFVLLPVLGWRFAGMGAAVASVISAAGGSIMGFWLLQQWNNRQLLDVLLRLSCCAAAAWIAGYITVRFASAVAMPSGWAGILAALVMMAIYVVLLIAMRLLAVRDLSRFRRILGREN